MDLNPIRAKEAKAPETSDFTSVQVRIENCLEVNGKKNKQQKRLHPELLPVREFSADSLSEFEYIALVDETGRLVKDAKGQIPPHLSSVLERLKLRPESWLEMQTHKRKLFRRAIGPVASLRQLADKMGKQWLHGIKAAQSVFV